MDPDATSGEQAAAAALVAGQGVLALAVVVLPRRAHWPTPRPLRALAVAGQLAGLTLSVVGIRGLGSALTASPLPRSDGELRTDGVYAVVRHPIYAGLLLAVTARAIGSGNRRSVGAAVALAGLLHVKAGFEERHLAGRYPDYPEYAARTGRLLPFRRDRDGILRP